MNGSEKQVKWAEDIKIKALAKVAQERETFEGHCSTNNISADNPDYIKAVAIFERCVAKLEARMEAKWWIDNRVSLECLQRAWIKWFAEQG